MGELFRDRNLLDILTIDRFPAETLAKGLLFFLFALRNVAALGPSELDTLYARFVEDSDNQEYWRAWWQGVRLVMNYLDTDVLRNTILSQIQRTEWPRLHFQAELQPNAVISIVSNIVDSAREPTGIPIMGWDYMPVIRTVRYLLRCLVLSDVDDSHFRKFLYDILNKLFQNYPLNGAERINLANHFFSKASTGEPDERGTDLELLHVLLVAEPSEFVLDGKREEMVHKLCAETPPLPVVILNDLAEYKERRYNLGRENTELSDHIRLRCDFLMSALDCEKLSQGNFQFTQEVLEGFWSKVLSSASPASREQEERFWGGDYITECMRDILFEFLWKCDICSHAGLVNLLSIQLIAGCTVFQILYRRKVTWSAYVCPQACELGVYGKGH